MSIFYSTKHLIVFSVSVLAILGETMIFLYIVSMSLIKQTSTSGFADINANHERHV